MIGRVATTGHPSDIVDALMVRTRGEVLATPAHATGGEYDCWPELVDRCTMRRLIASGLVSAAHGVPADRLADVAGWDGTPDTFVAWYLAEAVAGLDARKARRSGDAWEDRCEPEPETDEPAALPGDVLEYLLRLVFGAKADYAAAYAWHLWHGAAAPADPGTDWAAKARHKLDGMHRRHGKAGRS